MTKKESHLDGEVGVGKDLDEEYHLRELLGKGHDAAVATLDVEHSDVRFLGGLVLNLWDCGGQDAFYESYFDSQRDLIFRGVEVLIYVFDIESAELEKDFAHYEGVLEAMEQNSPDAKVFILVHKMDLVAEEERDAVFDGRRRLIAGRSGDFAPRLTCFATSIWDETLYKAWSSIVYSLIPNVALLERHLRDFCEVCGADEVVLFESATFLVISHATTQEHYDPHRFEKVSNIIKQFKLSCSKTHASFRGMEVRNSRFAAHVDALTENTYVMVVQGDPAVRTDATRLNIEVARRHFEKFIPKATA
eukprot:CAMPEP_0194584794 /NCGR_PEP_ID=MMETSP0292-20121207/17287_1 /TAXON_ID=39354 /ORGANISM="Heterosigma akashiwo, Strain CCMP2393" /LENGTH=304 /DNA_ID=CAMNT_0039439955 /DNA_START=216 /DNA_END=1131 /DNA_ORIENTATION=-